MFKSGILLGLLLFSGFVNAQTINSNDERNLSLMRIGMLESALAPQSATQVPIVWANAIKQRNGAVQYMLICPQLQNKYFTEYLAQNTAAQVNPWVSGWSSPRVISYKLARIADNQYKVTYTWTANIPNTTDTLTIQPIAPNQQQSQRWCIDHLVTNDFGNKIKELK